MSSKTAVRFDGLPSEPVTEEQLRDAFAGDENVVEIWVHPEDGRPENFFPHALGGELLTHAQVEFDDELRSLNYESVDGDDPEWYMAPEGTHKEDEPDMTQCIKDTLVPLSSLVDEKNARYEVYRKAIRDEVNDSRVSAKDPDLKSYEIDYPDHKGPFRQPRKYDFDSLEEAKEALARDAEFADLMPGRDYYIIEVTEDGAEAVVGDPTVDADGRDRT